MMSRPRLLYVSPVPPALTGNGLAMRAGVTLEILATRYDIYLLVIPLYPPVAASPPPALARLCAGIATLSYGPYGHGPSRPVSPRRLLKQFFRAKGARETPDEFPFAGVQFDVLHLFRLSILQFASPYLRAFPRPVTQHHLDMDDVESATHRRLAQLHRMNGNDGAAGIEEAQAERFEALEREVLPSFDRIYVCSERDRQELQPRSPAEVHVLPNAVRLPALHSRRSHDPFTFLFAGTLGYYPNEDAIRYFCVEVLPILRSSAPDLFEIHIVGAGATERIEELTRIPEVRLIGAVPDMGPYYDAAGAVVVPVRAGGGTRIKVLEAFSYRCPVVSTTLGVEGIDAADEEHVLIADTAVRFAEQCVRLMTDFTLARRLGENGYMLVSRAYTPEVLAGALSLG